MLPITPSRKGTAALSYTRSILISCQHQKHTHGVEQLRTFRYVLGTRLTRTNLVATEFANVVSEALAGDGTRSWSMVHNHVTVGAT